MKSSLTTFKLVVVGVVVAAAVMLSFMVFGAVSWSEVTDNLAKLVLVGLIICVTSIVISMITGPKDSK